MEADGSRDSKWMSGSAYRKNDRREAQPRAEELEKTFVRAPPERVTTTLALLTKTYHGCRLRGSNPDCNMGIGTDKSASVYR